MSWLAKNWLVAAGPLVFLLLILSFVAVIKLAANVRVSTAIRMAEMAPMASAKDIFIVNRAEKPNNITASLNVVVNGLTNLFRISRWRNDRKFSIGLKIAPAPWWHIRFAKLWMMANEHDLHISVSPESQRRGLATIDNDQFKIRSGIWFKDRHVDIGYAYPSALIQAGGGNGGIQRSLALSQGVFLISYAVFHGLGETLISGNYPVGLFSAVLHGRELIVGKDRINTRGDKYESRKNYRQLILNSALFPSLPKSLAVPLFLCGLLGIFGSGFYVILMLCFDFSGKRFVLCCVIFAISVYVIHKSINLLWDISSKSSVLVVGFRIHASKGNRILPPGVIFVPERRITHTISERIPIFKNAVNYEMSLSTRAREGQIERAIIVLFMVDYLFSWQVLGWNFFQFDGFKILIRGIIFNNLHLASEFHSPRWGLSVIYENAPEDGFDFPILSVPKHFEDINEFHADPSLLAFNKSFSAGFGSFGAGLRGGGNLASQVILPNKHSDNTEAEEGANNRSRKIGAIKPIIVGVVLLLCALDGWLLYKITRARTLRGSYGFLFLAIVVWIPIPFIFSALWD